MASRRKMKYNIFKIEYNWYEGEHKEALLAKSVERQDFEKDLLNAKDFAKSLLGKKVRGDYLGKGYPIECLPEYYEQIIWFLINKKEYIQCNFNRDTYYSVNEDYGEQKINLTKFEKSVKSEELK